jgi:AraC-like DNA-binding protein
MAWRTFNDFDAWGDTIRTADLRLVCDAVERREWQHAVVAVDNVILQMAVEGGGNLCYGANTHVGHVLFLPLTHTTEHVVNCERLDEGSLLLIPPGCDFTIQVQKRAHAWCSVALPAFEEAGADLVPGPLTSGATAHVLRSGIQPVKALKDLIRGIITSPLAESGATPAGANAAAAIVEAVRACLVIPREAVPQRGRPRIDRGEVIRRSLAVLESETQGRPSVADLAGRIGVTERTLARAFYDAFGVNPLRYMTLRQLHRVRRSLVDAAEPTTVSAILMQHGIWEHGRFSGRYRKQFGETPAHTLQHYRPLDGELHRAGGA